MGGRRERSGHGHERSLGSLVPFLFGYVRKEWRILVAAILATAIYAGFNAARAPIAGLFSGKVFLRDTEGEREARARVEALEARLRASGVDPADVRADEAAAPSDAGAGVRADADADAGGLRERARGWTREHVPFVARGEAWWRDARARWGWEQWLYACAALLAVVAVGMGVSNVFRELLQEAVVLRVLIALRLDVARHLLGLSLRFFHQKKLGDLYSRLTNDIGHTHQALTFLFVDIFEAVLLIAAYVSMCLWASWKLSLLAVVVAPPVLVVMRLFGKKIRRRSRGRQVSQGELTEEMQQMLTGIRTVKAFDNEEAQLGRFARANHDVYKRALRVVRAKAMSRGLVEILNHWTLAVLLVLGVVLVLDRQLVAKEDLVIFIGAIGLMYDPAKKLVRAYGNLSDAAAAIDRVRELLDERPEVVDRPGAETLGQLRGEVLVEGVVFAYEGEPVLRGVSFRADPGEVVALVGESGAGKSTMIDLLARFYDPSGGAIRIDGKDLRDVTRTSYLRQVAMVHQEPFLFNASVAENLRYARPDASQADLEAACRAANIHDAVVKLEAGYDTVLGERGVMLSGGQRQRLTIARALLKDPRILLLDEATSALDSESERLVQEALERLMAGRTTIVVAHRLSTVMKAQRILVLDQGRVVEEGTHAELVARGGRYARYHALQTA